MRKQRYLTCSAGERLYHFNWRDAEEKYRFIAKARKQEAPVGTGKVASWIAPRL